MHVCPTSTLSTKRSSSAPSTGAAAARVNAAKSTAAREAASSSIADTGVEAVAGAEAETEGDERDTCRAPTEQGLQLTYEDSSDVGRGSG
jgi:hypothetical protein